MSLGGWLSNAMKVFKRDFLIEFFALHRLFDKAGKIPSSSLELAVLQTLFALLKGDFSSISLLNDVWQLLFETGEMRFKF